MNNILEFKKPAQNWIDGTPLGNGSMGFMHYTDSGREIFSFNHDSLFRKNITKKIVAKDKIEEIRSLIENNENKKAQELFSCLVDGIPETCNPYQPLADLVFEFQEEELKEYTRTLDLEKALLNISYKTAKNRYNWEAFASNPANVAVIRICTQQKSSVRLFWTREEDPDCKWDIECNDGKMTFTGDFTEGNPFYATLKIEGDGNAFYCEDGITYNGFTYMTVYVAVGLGALVTMRSDYCYETIKNNHTSDFSALYNRFSIELNNELKIYEYIVNMARYMMISSSRSGSKPMNLQGLWCHDLKPDWDCGYTTDINVEMCYWIANSLNLSECQKPLFDWIVDNTDTMKIMASDIFGVDNAVYIPQYTDLYMTPTCWKAYSSFQVLWSGAAAWFAQHFFEYWKYSGDNNFMLNTAYPYMKLCANFYILFLVKDDDGVYELIPAANPENWTTDGAQIMKTTAMDVALIHELMGNLLYVNNKLEINDADASKWEDINKNIKPYYIDKDGALSEFTEHYAPRDPSHRHISHIYGLYPAKTFMNDELLTSAARKAIDKRLEGGLMRSATWSMAWYCCCFARLYEGNKSLEFVDHIIKSGLMENFLTAHNDWRGDRGYSEFAARKIFQIEGLMGAAAGITEMLISTNDERTILLPALPVRWTDGKVCGLCGYGAFEYDIEWKNSKIEKVVIRSKNGGNLNLEIGIDAGDILCDHPYELKEDKIIFAGIEKNQTINIEF